MVVRPLHTALLVALAGAGTSCSALPEDHGLRDFVERPFRVLRRDIDRGVAELQANMTRGIARTNETILELPGAALRELSEFERSTRREVGGALSAAERFPGVVVRAADEVVADARSDLGRIGRPFDLPYEPFPVERTIARTRTALEAAPQTLGLDRTPWPDASDPDRQVEIEPAGRRPSWLERILSRLRF